MSMGALPLVSQSLTQVMITCLHFGDQGALFAEARRQAEEKEEANRPAAEKKVDDGRRESSSSLPFPSAVVTGERFRVSELSSHKAQDVGCCVLCVPSLTCVRAAPSPTALSFPRQI